MKRTTSLHRDFDKKPQLRKIWLQSWDNLDQDRIRSWVRRIIRHIREVIRLEGDNNYREGAEDKAVDLVARQLEALSLN